MAQTSPLDGIVVADHGARALAGLQYFHRFLAKVDEHAPFLEHVDQRVLRGIEITLD